MTDTIKDVDALESRVGRVSAAVDMKVIDHLDEGALRWIAASPILFAAFGDREGISITVGGGAPGFVQASSPTHLKLPKTALDDPQLAREGQGFGALFLTPAIGETLRVNGRVLATDGGEIDVAVEECYVHCAKALIRSSFWAALPQSAAPVEAADFLAASRFMTLATINTQGHADLSPKGDPAGAMLRIDHDSVWYADRPGNRRVDSFRNILEQPRIAAAVLIPGSTRMVILSGTARITTDTAMCASFTVDGKTPRIATLIEQPTMIIRDSEALIRASLWPVAPRARDVDPAAMFVAHIKLNKAGGMRAKLMRSVLSVPGLMEKGLQLDYKHNLY